MREHNATIELRGPVVEFIQSHATLTLATASPSAIPHASTYLYVSDGPLLYIWMRPETTTAQHVERNPAVAFTIGDDVADPSQARGIQGVGDCQVLLSGEKIAEVARRFGEAFPELSPGNTLSISFYRISPSSLEFIDNTTARAHTTGGAFGAEYHKTRAYSVFDDLPLHEVETFVAALNLRRLAAGEVLVREGGPADRFFIVAEGQVELLHDYGDEPELLSPGCLFGELAVMRDTPRRTTVRATMPTAVWALERETFRELMARAIGTTPGFDEVLRSRLGLLELR